jgi:Rrf2 family protein
MLSRADLHSLKALLELALEPSGWRSVAELAEAQQLPAAMLEQLLLRLRRAGLVEARRGRHGGYRLARPPAEIALQEVLAALTSGERAGRPAVAATGEEAAGEVVTRALQRRLEAALQRELARITLEELLYDLRSSRAALSVEGGLLLG